MGTQDGRSRVTVVGERKRIDIAVPSLAPIGEYVAGLAEMCGQTRRGVMPAAWSLAPAGAPALPLGACLAEAGIGDGQVLYLQDVARDPGSAAVVDDIDEMVIGEAQRLRDNGLPRGVTIIGFGVAWLAAAAVFLFVDNASQVIATAVSLATGGLLLLSIGWALELRRSRVPAAMCLSMALASIPCFAVAGAMLAISLGGSGFGWLGAAIGCNAGAILTLAATPEALVFAIEVPFAVAMVVVPVLTAVAADARQCAVAVAVIALGLVGVARPIAAAITVFSRRALDTAGGHGQVTTQVLIRSQQLVAVVVAGPVVAMSASVTVLARLGAPFDLALAAVVTIAVAIRARQAVVKAEVVLLSAGAVVGAFAVVSSLLRLLSPGWWLPTVLVGFGLLVVASGVVSTLNADPKHPGGEPAELGPPKRHPLDALGPTCSVLTAPLALGAFGVLGQLVTMGRGLLS